MFLPISVEEGRSYYRDFTAFDVIFVSGDSYYDHPLSGGALLARLLDCSIRILLHGVIFVFLI